MKDRYYIANQIVVNCDLWLNECERKCLIYLLSEVLKSNHIEENYVLSEKKICELFEIPIAYKKNIIEILKEFRDTSFWIVNDKNEEILISIIDKIVCVYKEQQKYEFVLYINPNIIQYASEICEGFTHLEKNKKCHPDD